MKKFVITEDLAQAILNYLGTRPYVEVHKIVPGLLALEVLNEATPEAPVEAPQDAITPEVL